VIRGETRDEAMQAVLEQREPRVKIAKLHSGFQSADYFLFAADEMLRHPDTLEALIKFQQRSCTRQSTTSVRAGPRTQVFVSSELRTIS